MKKLILIIVLLFAATTIHADTPAKKTYTATVDADGVQRVALIGGGYFFDPYHIIVKVNQPVELSVRKESGMVPHNIVVKAAEAGIDFEQDLASDPRIIKFTPTRTGKYPMYCSKKLLFFESHREKGMEGILEVVP